MRFKNLSATPIPSQHGFPLEMLEIFAGGFLLTAALIGSFLRGYVKWQKKPPADPSEDQKQKQWNQKQASTKMQVFPAATPPCPPPPPPAAPDDYVHSEFDNGAEFDPEQHYTQVLAEARTHLQRCAAEEKLPLPANISSTQQQRTSWLQSSEQQLAAYRKLESAFAAQTASKPRPASSGKSAKLWKSLLFWQRPKKRETAELSSIFTNPQHPSFRAPRPSTPKKSGKPRRGNSGPIYTDGLPCRPSNRPRKPSSGPLATRLFFHSSAEKLAADFSPYEPLEHPVRLSLSAPSPPPIYSV